MSRWNQRRSVLHDVAVKTHTQSCLALTSRTRRVAPLLLTLPLREDSRRSLYQHDVRRTRRQLCSVHLTLIASHHVLTQTPTTVCLVLRHHTRNVVVGRVSMTRPICCTMTRALAVVLVRIWKRSVAATHCAMKTLGSSSSVTPFLHQASQHQHRNRMPITTSSLSATSRQPTGFQPSLSLRHVPTQFLRRRARFPS